MELLTFPILIALTYRLGHSPSSPIRTALVTICFFAMLGFSLADRALANEANGNAFTLIGRVAGPVRAVAVSGDYAYVGVGYKLLVFNVVDPVHPRLVFEGGALAAEVEGIALGGDYAYVAAGEAGLEIYNIDDPSAPVLAGSVITDGAAGDVVVLGNHAYIPAQAAGLRIVDVSDRAAPVEVGHYDNRNYDMRRVAVRDNLAYVTTHPSGLRILDVTDPAAPVEVGRLTLPGRAQGIALDLHHAYIAAGAAGLRIVNISDPRHPTEVAASIKHNPEDAYDVVVSEDYAYVADRAVSNTEGRIRPGGLRIVNIRTPRRPVAMGKVKGSAWSVDVTRGHVLDISTPSKPKKVSELAVSPSHISDMTLSGTTLYLTLPAIPGGGLRAIDVSDPAKPRLKGEYQMSQAFANAVAVLPDDVIALGSSEGLLVLELAAPQ